MKTCSTDVQPVLPVYRPKKLRGARPNQPFPGPSRPPLTHPPWPHTSAPLPHIIHHQQPSLSLPSLIHVGNQRRERRKERRREKRKRKRKRRTPLPLLQLAGGALPRHHLAEVGEDKAPWSSSTSRQGEAFPWSISVLEQLRAKLLHLEVFHDMQEE